MQGEAGHEVAYFGMLQPQTIDTPWKKYFVDEIHFDRSEGIVKDVKKVAHMIWSTEARRKFSVLLDDFKPDLVHLHVLYHQVSPSILPELGRRKIAAVMTSHDYHLISPNYALLTRGKPCGTCLGGSFWRTVGMNCLDSAGKSVAGAVEHLVHRTLRVYEKNIQRVMCPSKFMYDLFIKLGIKPSRLAYLPNPVFPKPNVPVRLGDAVVYAGRLSSEKGVSLLLEAAEALPAIPFVIIGDGPERSQLENVVHERRLGNVQLLGFKQGSSLWEAVGGARLVTVPSVYYENFPYAALEPMGIGKAVVASRIGGIPEIIRDGETGFLVPPRDAAAFIDKIKEVYYRTDLLARVGNHAAAYVRTTYDPAAHLGRLEKIYAEAQAAYS